MEEIKENNFNNRRVKKNKVKIINIFFLNVFIYLVASIYFLVDYNSKINTLNKQIEAKDKVIHLLEGELNQYKKIEQEKIDKQDYINSVDLETDSSITKFVNSLVSFENKKYIPENLVNIYSDYVYDTKGNSQLVRTETNEALQKLAKSFYKEFEKKITIVSAYRSYDYQKGIKDRGCPDNLCAKAGFSEHQSGLAIDFFEATNQKEFLSKPNLKKYFEWLNANANKYGFHNTYQKGLEIDGYEIEPWHWRYVGEELATYLKENNITIAEFYKNRNNNLTLVK